MTRLPLLLLPLLAAGALALVALGDSRGDATLGHADPSETAAPAAALLHAGAGPERAPAPALEIRERPASPEDGAAAPERGPLEVTVLDAAARPLPGMMVDRGDSMSPVYTDDHGVAAFGDVPYDGSVSIGVRGDLDGEALHGVGGQQRTTIHGPTCVVRLAAAALEDTYELVDAETGSVLWEMPGDGAVRGLGATTRIEVDGEVAACFEDHVIWDDPTYRAPVSAYATRLRIVHPLRREVPVTLSVYDHEGAPTSDVALSHLRVAGRTIGKPVTHWDATGRLHIGGIPLLRDESLRAEVTPPQGPGGGIEIRLPRDVQPLDLRIDLPPPWGPANNGTIGIGGSGGRGLGGRSWGRRRFVFGSVSLQVLRHDGTPARWAAVSVGGRTTRTDDRGRARVDRVRVGTYTASVTQIGLLPTRGDVVVRANERTHVTLREPKGGALAVHVVDGNGEGLPYVRLQIRTPSGQPWVDMHGGTQRLDPFTDHEGKRVLRRVESGTATIVATWGSRRAQVEARVAAPDGADPAEAGALRIVLPARE